MLSSNLKQQLFACCVLNNLFETCLLKAQCEGPCSNKNILSAVGSCCVLFRSQTAYFASLENFQRVLLLWNVQSSKSVWTAYWFSFGTILMFFFVFVATCDLVCVFFGGTELVLTRGRRKSASVLLLRKISWVLRLRVPLSCFFRRRFCFNDTVCLPSHWNYIRKGLRDHAVAQICEKLWKKLYVWN